MSINQKEVRPSMAITRPDNIEEIKRSIGIGRTEAERIQDERIMVEFTLRLKKEGYSVGLIDDFAARMRMRRLPPNYIAGAITVLLSRRAEEAEREYTLERLIRLTENLSGDTAKKVAEELSKISLYTTSRGWAAEANIDLNTVRPSPEQFGYYPDGADTIIMLPDSTGIATLYLDDFKHGYQLGTYLSKIRYPFKTLYIENTAQANAYLHIQIAKGDITTSLISGYGFCIARTTTALGANATYTSASFNALSFQRISIECLADQASIVAGLRIQQSIDGTNWDFQNGYNLAANVGQCQAVERMGQFIRVQLVNGAVAQTILRFAAFVR